jgi:hypothetical protein
MLRYQKWLSAGLLALTPGIAMAGALDFPTLKPRQGAAAPRPPKKSRAAVNQELAEKIAKALRNSKLDGYDIDIDVRDGVVILEGFVTRPEQRTAAAKAARAVQGVTAVNNRLRVADPGARPQTDQSAAEPQRPSRMPVVVRQANYQTGNDRPSAIQQAVASDVVSNEAVAQIPNVPTGTTANSPQPYAGYALYNPGPAYVQNQSSAAAWPYMGPFHPYPQCPLGWRKVTMYWDEGLWKLDFGAKKHWWQ